MLCLTFEEFELLCDVFGEQSMQAMSELVWNLMLSLCVCQVIEQHCDVFSEQNMATMFSMLAREAQRIGAEETIKHIHGRPDFHRLVNMTVRMACRCAQSCCSPIGNVPSARQHEVLRLGLAIRGLKMSFHALQALQQAHRR